MKKILLIVAGITVAASTAHAGLVQTFGIGAGASAQGEAVAAYADDPFAVYYNPAGLTLIKKTTVSSGITVFDAKVKVTDFSITSAAAPGSELNPWPKNVQSNGEPVLNPAIGFAVPLTDRLGFGMSAYIPYGLNIEWDSDYTRNPGALYAWQSTYYREVITPGFGYRLTDNLSAGFSLSLGRSVSEAGKTYPTTPATKLELQADDSFNYSFNVGLMYRPVDALSLGLTYRSRTDADFKGDVIINGAAAGPVTMEYDHPECIQAGARVFVGRRLSIECDLLWTRWSINDVQVETSPLAPGGAFRHNRNWTDECQYKIGVSWQVVDSLVFRSGYTYDPTPVPDSTFDMGWPDTDRNVFNIGFGWALSDHWSLDGVVQHVRSTSVRKISGTSEEMNAVYGEIIHGATGLPADTVSVSLGDEGILWGYGLNLNYTF
ncbi:OmpP1/FadL family transporter [Desulfatiferula olefinivorans]